MNNLSGGYKGITILDNLSFEVFKGEVFVILGGSGCGKSTLLKLLTGLLGPMKGEIRILGKEITSLDRKERLEILKQMGVAFQSGALFGSMTVLENIRLPLEELSRLPEEAMDMVAMTKLRLVGLDQFAHFMPDALSGGMKKRAAIARAMAMDPEILFLDEPSAGLDPVTSAGLDQLILKLSSALGITFVIVTHDMELARRCDRVFRLTEHGLQEAES